MFTTVPVSDGNHMHEGESTVLWDAAAAEAMFTALDEDQPLPPAPKVTPVEVAPGEISVAVTPTGPHGEQAVTDLESAGFALTTAESASSTPATTVVEYDPAYPKSLATVQAVLPDAEFEQSPGIGETFQITVGADYTGAAPVRSATNGVEATARSAKDDICQ